LNLTLHAREARGVPQIQWASIAEAHQKISENELSCILVGGIVWWLYTTPVGLTLAESSNFG